VCSKFGDRVPFHFNLTCPFITLGENAITPYFTVHPKDIDGNLIKVPKEKFSVSVVTLPEAGLEVLPNPDGSFGVKWKPPGFGEYKINIKIEDQHIKGSPFHINIGGKTTEKEEHPNPKQTKTPKSEPIKLPEPTPIPKAPIVEEEIKPRPEPKPKYVFDKDTPINQLIKVNAIELLRAVQDVVKSATDTNCTYEMLVALASKASDALRKLDTLCEEHPAIVSPSPKTKSQIAVLMDDNEKLKEATLVIMTTVRVMLPDRFNENNQKELAIKITSVVSMVKKMVASSNTLQQLAQ